MEVRQKRGVTFLSNSPSSFLSVKKYFLVIKRTSSHPVCLPLHQFYFQVIIIRIMHFFTIISNVENYIVFSEHGLKLTWVLFALKILIRALFSH